MQTGLKEEKKVAAPVAHFCQDLDLSLERLKSVLRLAADMKKTPRNFSTAMAGKYLALLFEKPSLRTAVGFELAMKQMGGDTVQANGTMGQREPVKDMARILGRWVDGMAARVFAQSTVDELAEYSGVPVVNALSDLYHPCQALADMLTLRERWGHLPGRRLAFVGDGNNVATSLAQAAVMLGVSVHVAAPHGYTLPAPVVERIRGAAREGAELRLFSDPLEAVAGVDAVYTDVWTSMGQERETDARRQVFASFQVNSRLMHAADAAALFMHCLPAHRGEEVTADVFESPASVVFDQAENRLHTQKALLSTLLAR